ncbi:hypothetical protein ACSBOB_19580 [Mesorhizobium sp. ASY16-5R]|uniref:hypothetical protein n=1 Tax=Mesorhizobium sp. ASY16-5R TaxID=3445772 RepID=UPI003FA148D8
MTYDELLARLRNQRLELIEIADGDGTKTLIFETPDDANIFNVSVILPSEIVATMTDVPAIGRGVAQ